MYTRASTSSLRRRPSAKDQPREIKPSASSHPPGRTVCYSPLVHTFCFPISTSSTDPPSLWTSAAAASVILLISPLFSGHADTLWMATHSASFCLQRASGKGSRMLLRAGRDGLYLQPLRFTGRADPACLLRIWVKQRQNCAVVPPKPSRNVYF